MIYTDEYLDSLTEQEFISLLEKGPTITDAIRAQSKTITGLSIYDENGEFRGFKSEAYELDE